MNADPISHSSPFLSWRSVAIQFHGVQQCVDNGTLRADFEPVDLARLRKKGATGALRGVFAFLLHIYNSSNRFDLAEVQRWDAKHIGAFTLWASGQGSQQPCHYF